MVLRACESAAKLFLRKNIGISYFFYFEMHTKFAIVHVEID